MNIAILIGVSRYAIASPLPACVADVEYMHRLLSATKKYEEIYCLTNQTNASQLKDELRDFFKRYQGNPHIDEVFVYFSGHGIYQNDALLCCSDFDHNRPATTSIGNKELDDLLRSVRPKVAVKVIDACQSGSPYIKEAGAGFEKALGSSQLESFICMSSSRQDQSSYASANESNFTKKWIDAALEKQNGNVLYRDIQAALADAFVSNPEQTPFFVTQGTGLELFACVSEEMQNLKIERDTPTTTITTSPETNIVDLIEAEVMRMDDAYISYEDACNAISQTSNALIKEVIIDPLVTRFYDKRVLLDKRLAFLPCVKEVAEFAAEQKWSKRYFVRVDKEEYEEATPNNIFKVNTNLLSKLASSGYLEDKYKSVKRYRPYSLTSTQPLPFEVAEIIFEANKHPSLKAFNLYIGIVHSLTEVMVLSAVMRLSQKGWTERSPDLADIQWKYQSFSWKDVEKNPRLIWEEPVLNGQSTIRAYLEGCAASFAESEKRRNLSGLWVCQYHYPKLDDSSGKKIKTIETQIVRFEQEGDLVKGTTVYAIAHPENFEGRVTKDRYFTGQFSNKNNHQNYHGTFQFVISNSHNRMLGKWVGFNRDGTGVDAEEWRWLQLDSNSEISKDQELKYINDVSHHDLFSIIEFL